MSPRPRTTHDRRGRRCSLIPSAAGPTGRIICPATRRTEKKRFAAWPGTRTRTCSRCSGSVSELPCSIGGARRRRGRRAGRHRKEPYWQAMAAGDRLRDRAVPPRGRRGSDHSDRKRTSRRPGHLRRLRRCGGRRVRAGTGARLPVRHDVRCPASPARLPGHSAVGRHHIRVAALPSSRLSQCQHRRVPRRDARNLSVRGHRPDASGVG